MSIVTNDATDFRRGNCRDVENSRTVDIAGIRLSSGVVLATRIDISRGGDASPQE
jgi:hypothetical protein